MIRTRRDATFFFSAFTDNLPARSRHTHTLGHRTFSTVDATIVRPSLRARIRKALAQGRATVPHAVQKVPRRRMAPLPQGATLSVREAKDLDRSTPSTGRPPAALHPEPQL